MMLDTNVEKEKAAGKKRWPNALWAMALLFSTLPVACLPEIAELTIDVQPESSRISAADPLAISDQNTIIHSNVNGGTGPYSFYWTVKDPMGTTRNELLDDVHSGDPVFHPGPLVGPYLLTCTVTDSALKLVSDSAIIYVSQDLGLSLSVNRKEVPSGGGVNGQIEITSEIWGGSPPYSYQWSAVGPDGAPADEVLSGNANAAKLFTSGYELGTYRITCKVTDATKAFTSQATEVIVNHLLSVNVSSDRPIVTPGGGLTGLSLLMANVSGGKAPYGYSWVVLGPDGNQGQWLESETSAEATFTSPTQPGTYRAICTVTDARGEQVVGSMLIMVDQQLSVSVITNRQRVSSDGGVFGQAVVKALVVGGTTPYKYYWTVLDPEGEEAFGHLDDATSAAPTFTSTSVAGTYQFICQVTDGVGQIAADSLEIIVGQPLAAELSVTSSRSAAEGGAVDSNSEWVASGGGPNGQATISAEAIGGSPPYTYAWNIVGPDGQPALDRLSGSAANTRFFHSSNDVGTYRVTCTITDSTGVSYNDSVKIAVYSHLKLDVTMDRVQMPANGGPDGTAHLNSVVLGGTAPFTYAWTITGPDGLIDNSRLDDATLPNPTFTSGPASGIYRARCVLEDSVGQVVEGTLLFMVGQPVTLDVILDRTDVIASGGQAHLRADARGGIPPYQYSWTVTNPTGGAENERLDDTLIAAPTFTSALTTGTYSFTCTVTDSAGFVAILSTSLVVGGGLDQGLSIAVSADRQGLAGPGSQAALFGAVLGGVPPVTYEWVVVDPNGALDATALSDATIPNPIFTAPATIGTYRISCTIMDSVLKRFTDAIQIYVGMPLSVDVRTDKLGISATGGQAVLTATVNGGVSAYTYAWTALNPAGASANAALSNLAVAAPTFTAPATPGTYRFTCAVTDAAGTTANHSLEIYVGMALSLDVTTAKESLPSTQTTAFNGAGHGGISPYTYAWSVLDPTGADASVALSATNAANPTFTAPATAGTYRATCTVTDAANATFTQSMHIQVGMPLTLDVRTNNVTLPATGEQASLTATVNGGASPYTFAWTALNPTGASAAAALSNAAVASPTFTAPATAGTYRLTCTVTDAAGTTASASLEVYVGMGLSLNVTATKQSLPNTQTTALNAAAQGGLPAYTYAWSVLDPSGANANASLNNLAIAAPTFTAPATAGTYRVTCTVTDSANATATQTTHLYVGMPLTADVRTDKLGIPATGGQASLLGIANGGVSPYTYAWTALNPTGASAAAALNSTVAAGVTFTAPATAGTYRFTCTITDAAGTTASASLEVYVGMTLSLDVTTAKQSLPSAQPTTVSASAQGGIPAYTYAWSVLDSSGGNANAALNNLTIAAPTFTAPATAGTYRVTCTVTDSASETVSMTLHILVGMPLSADVLATKASIPASGGTTVITATANGGVSPYTYAWTATDPSAGNAAAALSATNLASPTFTAPATAGTYKFTCVVTDAAGTTFRDSTSVYVGMNLSLDVTTVKQSLPSAQTTAITASAQGGIAPYTYAWTVLDPSGGNAAATLSAANVANPTFTAPATAGTYRLTCTVTDGANETIKCSIHIYVGMPLTADVRTNKLSIPATGGQTTLIGIANGGATPYTYAWTALDPTGASAAATLSATNVASPTFTAPAAAGTYRFTCTVTDSAGTTANASLEVYVGMGLSLNVTTVKQSLPSAQTTAINASAQGGIAPYTYSWSVLNPSGGDAVAALSNAAVAAPTFTAPATAGTYRVTCTVTDAANETITRSAHIYVGMPLTVDVRTNKLSIPATAGQATLTGVANGGVSGYTYAWAALDPTGASAAAALNNTAVASPTFTAPATAGTYRFTCTATDSAGTTASASLEIYVGMALSLDVTIADQSLPSAQTSLLNVAAQGGISPYTYAWSVADSSGADASSSLDDATIISPTFTAPATAGTYRVTCTVTDAANETFTQSIHVYVGMPLTLDVRTDKLIISATGGQASLAAVANGGVLTYTYAWTATDPTGADASATLDDTTIAGPVFTAPATAGTYQFTCTVTDSAGTTASASLEIAVGTGLSLSVTSTKSSLPSGQTSALTATAQGGTAPYTYGWTALDPSGASAAATLTATNVANPTFTAPATAGTYRLTCTVTDAANATFTSSIQIQVGMPLTLDVRTDKASIPASGGQASLVATVNGGVSTYTYAWTALNPSGGSAAATLTNATTANATFTAPATAGTYRFTCTVTDVAGTTALQSIQVYVGMGLSLNVVATRQSLPGAQTTAVTASAQGGISGYTYAWSVLDPAGADASASLNDLTIAAPTFTAPATAGTYRVTCIVTDSASETVTQTILINVGMPLSVDVRTDKLGISATGGQAVLTATVNGGVSAYTYAWTALNPAGASANAALSNLAVAAPTFTAPATPGTYRFTCAVTDAAGTTANHSLEIYVGMALSLDVTTAKESLPSTQTTAFNAAGHGGISPYTYAWSVLDPTGADASATLSATNAANPTFTAPATAGTYRATCTVTDAANATFTQSMHIQVGMPLTLDVRTNKVTLPATGEQASLSATVNGGVSPYTYAWTALNPTGASAAAALTSTTVSAPTFTAPATAGTYRLTCTVTDAAGTTASASLEVYVGMGLSLNVTATKQALPSTQTTALNAAAQGGLPAYTYAWSVLDPSGGNANASLNNLTIAAPTFTAPATAGTYRVTCTVTDSANATATQTLHLYVGMPLTADVRTDKLGIPATGGQASLLGIANGGVSPYTYAWTALNPTGASAAAALSSTVAAGVTFTAPATAGTYRFTCTITDAAGTTASASLEVYVGMNLALDVTAAKQSLPSAQTTTVSAAAQGGIPAYTYAWSVLDSSGGNANASLNNLTIAAPTFTAPATAGTYRVTCTVTDSASETVSMTLHILVGMPLSADVLATKASIPASGGTTVITATANGGISPYTYAWTATDPSAGNAAAALSATNLASPTFTAPATAGTYRFTCVVTDAAGTTFRDSTSVYVGMNLSLDATTVKQSLPSAQTTAITASAQGGIAPYTYAWTVLDPSGGNAAATLSAANVANPTFTAPAMAGTYRLTCTVTDGANETIKCSIHIYVGGPLSVDVTTQYASIPAAPGTSVLTATVLGGVSTYTYAWSALDQTGASANAAISSLTIASPTFTAPAAGTYRILCTVTDSSGTTSSDSCTIQVGMPLSAYVLTTDSSLVSGKTATFSVTASGGTSPYTYAWTVLSPSSVNVTATTLSSATAASPTFTAPATNGTYRVTCTVTDARSATVTASLQVDVGMPLSADVTTTKSSLVSAATATLAANASGGATPYTYAWTVRDSAGTSVPTALSSATAASPTFTAPATAGTYRATCVVTDSDGQTFTDTTQIVVGMPLSLAVVTDKDTLTAAGTANLTAFPNGGISPYTYSWVVYNPSSTDVTATTLSSATAQMPVFTAPVLGGTYRAGCTVTDAAGATFVGAVHLYVATRSIVLTNPVAADGSGNPDSILPLTSFPSQYTVLVVDTDLTYARNLQVRVTDGNNSVTGSFYIAVDGVSADGHFQTEFFSFTAPGGGATVVGSKPFARVDLVRWVRNGAVGVPTPGGDERVSIGVGNIFGLPEILPSAASLRQVVQLPATTLATPLHWTFIATLGQQGVSFTNGASLPNGGRDYEIFFDDN